MHDVPVSVMAPAVVITGIAVVFVALVGLWFIVALFGRGFSSIGKKSTVAAPVKSADVPAATPQKVAPAVEQGIPPEVVAAISAAVYAMDSNYSLRSVRRAGRSAGAWKQAGLLQNTQPF